MTLLTLPHTTNGFGSIQSAETWMQTSVRDFFSQFNWEDHPPVLEETLPGTTDAPETEISSVKVLTLNMSVNTFFAAFNWDGAEIAAAVPVSPTLLPEQPSNDFTLDDFSGLF